MLSWLFPLVRQTTIQVPLVLFAYFVTFELPFLTLKRDIFVDKCLVKQRSINKNSTEMSKSFEISMSHPTSDPTAQKLTNLFNN